ncbi:MAG TPA: hypothetical protein VFP98_02875, partial [Candidatus Polarisedimenticolia bacterium]|nr:hypothetical protein [Candidatus Polarisedimenticolia bacterium]
MNDYGRSGLYLAAALMLGLAGPIGPVPEILGIAAGLAGWAATRPRSGDIPAVRDAIAMRLALRWTPVLLAAALIARAGPVALKLAIALVAVAASAGPARRHGPAFLAAALSWRLLADAVPAVWILHVETARSISRLAGLATGQRLDLGPTASGLDLFVLYLMLTAAARLDGLRAGARRVATAALVLLLFMIVLPVVARVPAGGPFN